MTLSLRAAAIASVVVVVASTSVMAQTTGAIPPPVALTEPSSLPPAANQYSSNEIIEAGHQFFGSVSRGLAEVVENAVSKWGLPNGYILGEEASGAFIGGLRYGDGTLYTRNAGDLRVFWEGPSFGFDFGAETRYDAGGQARNRLVIYAEDHSRVTGELNCIHIEWRVRSPRAIRAAGINSGKDLPEFDHRAFWQKRLLLYTVDWRHLGLLIRNRRMGTKRRSSRTYRTDAHLMDGRAGEVYARSYDTVQKLIDDLKSSCRIRLALKRIPNDSLLPE
jgi:hypothetical protein